MDIENKPAFYILTHTPTGIFYGGSSGSPKSRLRQHKSDLRCGRHHNKKFQSAFTDWSDISIEIQYGDTLSEVREYEQTFLNKSVGRKECCNVAQNPDGVWAKDSMPSSMIEKLKTGSRGRRPSEQEMIKRTYHLKEYWSRPENKIRRSEMNDVQRSTVLAKRGRKMIINGKFFNNAVEAAAHLGLSRECITSRCKSPSRLFKNWFYVDEDNNPVES